MAEDAGTIFYEVDAKTDKVIDAGKRAVDTLDTLQSAFDKTDRAADRNAKTMDKTARATDKEAAALSALLGKIDPVVAATRRLDEMQDQLSAAFAKGQLSASQYQSYLAKLDAQYKKLDGSTDSAQAKTKAFGSSLSPLASAIAGVITVQTLKSWGMLAEQFTLLQARIKRLSPDLDTAKASYQSLLTIASNTGATLPNTVKLWEALTSTLKDLGATNAQVLTLTDTLQKIGTVGGSSAEETANALRQLSQGLAAGTLRAEEFNSIVENTPELARQIAAGFKMSMGQLRQAMLDGKISAEALFDVLLGRGQAVNEEFSKLPRTVSQAGNAFTVAFGDALSKLDQTLNVTKQLTAELDKWTNRLKTVSGTLTEEDKLNSLYRERAQLLVEQTELQKSFFNNPFRKKEIEERLKGLNDEVKAIQEVREAEKKRSGGDAPVVRKQKTDTTEGQKALQQLGEQNALLRAQGEERAKIAALQKLGTSATQQERDLAVALAVDNYRLAEAEKERTKAKREGASEASKLETKAQAEIRRAAKERQTAADADQKQFAQLGQAIANVGQTAREAAQDAAQLSLSKFATPDEVQRIRDMAGALYDLKGARAALAQADPIAAEQMNYEDQLKQLQTLNDQKLLSDTRYLELKGQAETAHAEQMRVLQEENFKAQALGNEILLNSIDALSQSATQGIAGIISGTGSLQEALGGIANTVLNTVIGSFVQMGADWVKQQIIMAAAAQGTTNAQTAGIAAVAATQAGATASIAATTTATAATTGTAVATSMAPAAGLSSIASFGGAAVIGGAALLATMLLAKSFGGGRKAGGAVSGNSVYRVNEGGAPEIFTAGGQQYMIPNQRGEVVSNKNSQEMMGGNGGGAQAPIVNINNYGGSNASASSKWSEADRRFIVDVIVVDMQANGKSGQTVTQITGTQRRGS